MFEQGLFFRPDWEAVLTPVVDAMVSRAEVDAERLAVIGVSQAGFWVPNAPAAPRAARPGAARRAHLRLARRPA